LIAAETEISVEANPGTVTAAELRALRQAGCNRLSLGLQSLDDDDLVMLGRAHTVQDNEEAVQAARRAGFTNISIDLMYGLPGQSATSWRSILERVLLLAPEHLSIYQLTLEPGTAFYRLYEQGRLGLPDEDSVLAMDESIAERCAAHGYEHYEISNFSRPGYRCRHNLVYWHNDDYIGCGAGAVGCIGGVRKKKCGDPARYCDLVESGQSAVEAQEALDSAASFRETVIMGLRLIDGVSSERLLRRYGLTPEQVYGDTLITLRERTLIDPNPGRLRLTRKGRRLANVVMAELV
jgi:oxygen-independent coproporphyrinogen-3 oxidase